MTFFIMFLKKLLKRVEIFRVSVCVAAYSDCECRRKGEE